MKAASGLVAAHLQWHMERALRSLARGDEQLSKIRLLLSFDPDATVPDVPDPYYSEDAFFGTVLRQIETAVGRLFRQIQPAMRP